MTDTAKEIETAERAYRLYCLNRDNFNLSLLKYRDFDGFLVTGQHSGTHWIKWMLSHAIAHHYGVSPPRYFNNASAYSNDIIGHPKHPRKYPQLPRIASSHAIAPNIMKQGWFRSLVKLPPYVVVVRDPRDVLISNYEKWKGRYNCSFGEYVKGDPNSKRFITDIWNYMRFMNQWGAVVKRFPADTFVMHYEDFASNKEASLAAAAKHLRLNLTDADIAVGAAAGAKDVMARHHDPAVAPKALRVGNEGQPVYTPADEAFLKEVIRRNLRHDFGYDFSDGASWNRDKQSRAA